MPRKAASTTRGKKNDEAAIVTPKTKAPFDITTLLHTREDLKCKNKSQKDLVHAINEKEIVIAAGPAGVGKSYVTIARAIELLKNPKNPYKKIIVCTPAVEAEEKLGFLPGDMREKMDPYLASSMDIFDKIIGKGNRIKLEELGYLEVQALAYIRGKSIDNTILVLEEAQNMSPGQMKTLLTRIGENSKFIISGDLDQSDRYRNATQSGLYDALIKHKNVPDIGFVEFGTEDIVRNKVISKILANYIREEEAPRKEKFVRPTTIVEPKKTLFQKFLALFK